MKETKCERGNSGRGKEKAHKLIIHLAHELLSIRVEK